MIEPNEEGMSDDSMEKRSRIVELWIGKSVPVMHEDAHAIQ